jgi:nucleoside-diphosphate-sugar epimerase
MVAFTWQRWLLSILVIETGFGRTVQILPEPLLYLTQRSRLGRFPLCTPLRLQSTGTVPACLFASAQRSNRCRPMEPTNWGANYHAWVAGKVHALPSVGLRLFNVYGPGQDPKSPYSGVISIFCYRIPRGEPIEIFGDGRQSRDFIFVDDVVTALLLATNTRLSGERVLNICTGKATSVLNLAQTIANLCGQDLAIRFRPPRKGEITHSYGDPTDAKQTLGITSYTELRIGLSATLARLEGLRDSQ